MAHRLLHRALRVRVVERIVVTTALTHFRFWRRYRAPGRVLASDERGHERSPNGRG